ncbi:SDR family oxidoreductase [Nonomuraea typhae]|uniref:SDR family oxidoreductase n=1 Tax=Nonomuraea typhae TaxID=2603600 RepID=UPI0012F80ABC|nr:NmrA family transcriptional regulator [Nonomuraea typhae]
MTHTTAPILVLGGTGTVGSRVAAGLRAAGRAHRVAARRAEVRFDWSLPGTWPAALDGARTMFVLLPDQTALPDDFLRTARRHGVEKVVLHSDRAVDVMNVTSLQAAEAQVRASGCAWTIVRSDWFDQDFETFFRQPVLDGRLCVPVGSVRQGFVDAGDIAAVCVEALLGEDFAGRILPLTGPVALSFREALDHLQRVTGLRVEFDGTPDGYRAALRGDGVPEEAVETLIANFAAAAAQGDTRPTGVVEEVLGRPGKDFGAYAEEAAARGAWRQT